MTMGAGEPVSVGHQHALIIGQSIVAQDLMPVVIRLSFGLFLVGRHNYPPVLPTARTFL